MDRIIHQHLSSCGQTLKFVAIPAARRMQYLISLPCIKCGFRTEKVLSPKRIQLSSSSSSWSYFEVFGDVRGCLSPSDGTVCQIPYERTLHRGGSSRVLAAWEKIQSWNSAKSKSEAKSRGRPNSIHSSSLKDDHRRQSDVVCRIKDNRGPKTRKYIPSQAEAYTGFSRDLNMSRAISQPSSKKMNTKRELAVTAITQALTPSLQSRRHGDGELGLRMANFLITFMSSAQTNETRFCEKRVRKSLEIMLNKTEAAEREVKAIQTWINDAENQLHAMPSERDIEWLETLLDNLLCYPVVEYPSRLGRPSKEELAQDHCEQFLRASSDLKSTLANMPTVAEIQELQQEFEQIDKKLLKCSEVTKEAVNLLRNAIARGEVAWLRNLELGAAYLDAMALTVLPLEGLYTTHS